MKWIGYVVCTILTLLGIFFGIRFYQEITSTSYVNGDIDITNKFEQDAFVYSSDAIVLYPSGNDYVYETEVKKVEGFNGAEKDYKVMLNGYRLLNAEITAGRVAADVNMDFHNTDGTLACAAEMDIKIEFLSGTTRLTLVCDDEDSARYFEQYFSDNGMHLYVIELI